MNLAEELADYVNSANYRDVSEHVVHETKKRIIDSLGCAIGAFNSDPVKISRKVAGARVGSGSTLFGTRKKSTPDLTAFVNGIMVRYFDYNDTFLSKEPAHPSDNIAPCFSVAESEGSSGKELLLSIVLAYWLRAS